MLCCSSPACQKKAWRGGHKSACTPLPKPLPPARVPTAAPVQAQAPPAEPSSTPTGVDLGPLGWNNPAGPETTAELQRLLAPHLPILRYKLLQRPFSEAGRPVLVSLMESGGNRQQEQQFDVELLSMESVRERLGVLKTMLCNATVAASGAGVMSREIGALERLVDAYESTWPPAEEVCERSVPACAPAIWMGSSAAILRYVPDVLELAPLIGEVARVRAMTAAKQEKYLRPLAAEATRLNKLHRAKGLNR